MSEKLKLSTKREVTLNRLTMAQRIECQYTVLVMRYADACISVLGVPQAMALWFQHGLGQNNLALKGQSPNRGDDLSGACSLPGQICLSSHENCLRSQGEEIPYRRAYLLKRCPGAARRESDE